ncbi:MAG: mechanosensitive ion channel family protein [Oscillospiraceae bacterium]|nr:mechanosensitive ion channel family protein [Oscillospiraceae bacterium]
MLSNIEMWAASLASIAMTKLLPAVIILAAGILVIRIVMAILNKALNASKLEKAAHSLIKSLASVVLYLLLGLIVASSLGIDVTGIIALASVLTLAVSLALQNMLANVIGGFTLLYTRPFHSGDYVDIGADSGTVTEIGMTYTKLQTPDNKIISIPNSTVVAGDIVNYTATGTRRVDVAIRAAYCVPTQKVIDALIQAGTIDKVLLDPAPFAAIANYGENAIEYTLRVWTKTDDYWDVMFTINQNVKNIFDAQDIKMSYPHMYVHMK